MKILICGLPGSGKTWLAERLSKNINNCAWYNADVVRNASNDWDFSKEGRTRQAMRMKTFADFEKINGRFVICDFVAPTKDSRDTFAADYLIWLDTIKEGRVVENKKKELKDAKNLTFEIDSLENSQAFKDTTNMFEEPIDANKIITKFMNDEEINNLSKEILNV